MLCGAGGTAKTDESNRQKRKAKKRFAAGGEIESEEYWKTN